MYKVLLPLCSLFAVRSQFMRGAVQRNSMDPCQLADQTMSHSQVMYLIGDQNTKGSVYARCWNGKVECHIEEAIPDKPDTETVSCDAVAHPDFKRRLQVISNNPWPQGVVCYNPIDTALFSAPEIEIITRSFADFNAKTNLQFVQLDQCQALPNAQDVCGGCQNSIEFIKDEDLCYSQLGYQAEPGQVVSIGTDCFREDDFIIIHELGHAVGLFHEHSHPERNIVVLQDTIPPNVSPLNFIKNTDPRTSTTAYDVDSVMHYPLDSRMCIPKGNAADYCDLGQTENCIVPTEEDCDRADPIIARIGPDLEGLSAGDQLALATIYGDATAAPPTVAPIATATTAPVETAAPVLATAAPTIAVTAAPVVPSTLAPIAVTAAPVAPTVSTTLAPITLTAMTAAPSTAPVSTLAPPVVTVAPPVEVAPPTSGPVVFPHRSNVFAL